MRMFRQIGFSVRGLELVTGMAVGVGQVTKGKAGAKDDKGDDGGKEITHLVLLSGL